MPSPQFSHADPWAHAFICCDTPHSATSSTPPPKPPVGVEPSATKAMAAGQMQSASAPASRVSSPNAVAGPRRKRPNGPCGEGNCCLDPTCNRIELCSDPACSGLDGKGKGPFGKPSSQGADAEVVMADLTGLGPDNEGNMDKGAPVDGPGDAATALSGPAGQVTDSELLSAEDELLRWACSKEGCEAIEQYLKCCSIPDCVLPTAPPVLNMVGHTTAPSMDNLAGSSSSAMGTLPLLGNSTMDTADDHFDMATQHSLQMPQQQPIAQPITHSHQGHHHHVFSPSALGTFNFTATTVDAGSSAGSASWLDAAISGEPAAQTANQGVSPGLLHIHQQHSTPTANQISLGGTATFAAMTVAQRPGPNRLGHSHSHSHSLSMTPTAVTTPNHQHSHHHHHHSHSHSHSPAQHHLHTRSLSQHAHTLLHEHATLTHSHNHINSRSLHNHSLSISSLPGSLSGSAAPSPDILPWTTSSANAALTPLVIPAPTTAHPNPATSAHPPAPASASASTHTTPAPSTVLPIHICHWQNCHLTFSSMPDLLAHVAADHLGATGFGPSHPLPPIDQGQDVFDMGGVQPGGALDFGGTPHMPVVVPGLSTPGSAHGTQSGSGPISGFSALGFGAPSSSLPTSPTGSASAGIRSNQSFSNPSMSLDQQFQLHLQGATPGSIQNYRPHQQQSMIGSSASTPAFHPLQSTGVSSTLPASSSSSSSTPASIAATAINTTRPVRTPAQVEVDHLLSCLWDSCFPLPPTCSAEPPHHCPPHTLVPAPSECHVPHPHAHTHTLPNSADVPREGFSPQTMLRHVLEEHLGVPGSVVGWDDWNAGEGLEMPGSSTAGIGMGMVGGAGQAHQGVQDQGSLRQVNGWGPGSGVEAMLMSLGSAGDVLGGSGIASSDNNLSSSTNPARGGHTHTHAHAHVRTASHPMTPAQRIAPASAVSAYLPTPPDSDSHSDDKDPAVPALICRWHGCAQPGPFATPAELMDHLSETHVGKGKESYVCLWAGCVEHAGSDARKGHGHDDDDGVDDDSDAELDRAIDHDEKGVGDDGKKSDQPSAPVRGRTFRSRQKVLRHLQSHTGYKPFVCPICQQAFSEQAPLAAHLRRHKEEKPFVCPVEGCGKCFAISSSLTIHMRTHNGEKPFVCPHCNKGFVEASNLTKHIRTHTGEKPFPCGHPGCNKRFPRPDQLKRHMAVHDRQRERERAAREVGELEEG